MNKFLLFACLALPFVASGSYIRALDNVYTQTENMVMSDDMIAEVNRAKTTWVAGRNPRFETVTIAMARKMMGTRLAHTAKQTLVAAGDVPAEFDARTKWPSCIHPVRNQGQCGSCWAFGASEALSDRMCIATSGKTNLVLSAEDLVACDTTDMGCQGGYLQNAWKYMENYGVVSDDCFPYTSGDGSTPSCAKACTDSSTPFTKYKVKSGSIVAPSDAASIQAAILANGPVEGGFTVYQDFMSYTSGVYQHTTGGMLGGHAIKILGWGTDAGTDYWLVANSWGTSWGLDGFFKIKRGTNECGIEGNIVAGLYDQ